MTATDPGGGPVPALGGHHRPRAGSTRWIAYSVTIGVLVVLAFATIVDGEAWPVTSFRLFSQVRTDHSTSITLVAIDDDGIGHPVRADGNHEFVKRTTSQYRALAATAPTKARAMVDAWLASAGMDPDDYAAVELWQTRSRLSADGSPPEVLDERVTWRLDLQ